MREVVKDTISPEKVWETVQNDLPFLKEQLRELL